MSEVFSAWLLADVQSVTRECFLRHRQSVRDENSDVEETFPHPELAEGRFPYWKAEAFRYNAYPVRDER